MQGHCAPGLPCHCTVLLHTALRYYTQHHVITHSTSWARMCAHVRWHPASCTLRLQMEALRLQMEAHITSQLTQVLQEVADLRAEVRAGRARERALLLYGLLAMVLLVGGLLRRQVRGPYSAVPGVKYADRILSMPVLPCPGFQDFRAANAISAHVGNFWAAHERSWATRAQ